MGTTSGIKQLIKAHENNGKYLHIEGVKTFVLDQGHGEAVVCIHGVPTSSFLYRKVANSLQTKGFRTISIDLPGLGLSDRPENFDYGFPNFADFLSKALDQLNIEKYHLMVHDIGGPIGFVLAAKNLEKILSLTILNTWIDVENFKKPLPMRPFEKKMLGEAELKMITHTTWPVFFSKLGLTNAESVHEDEINAYVDLLKREDDGKAFLKIMRNFSSSPQYRDICIKAVTNVPYLVQAIWGKDDPGLTLERYGEEIQRYANLDSFTELPGKHFLQEEFPEEIAEKIYQLANKT